MPSPFPGMDPWLESPALFPDLHSGFIGRLRALLNATLPEPFVAALTTRVYMEDSERLVEPDVDILRPAGGSNFGSAGPVVLTPASSALLEIPTRPWPDDEITEVAIEIRTLDEIEQLVTSIEFLSRTNKTRGAGGRGLYLVKQRELQLAGVNLVEIDFLRAGVHATSASLPDLRRISGFDYHVSITRAEHWGSAFVAAIRLTQRLPVIPIPLIPSVPDVLLDLQVAFDQTYDEARYERRVRYAESCNPRLTAEQQTWAESILRSKGLLPPASAEISRS